MEFKAVVYNAVRDGNLKRLKLFIDLMRPDDVKRLLSPDIEPPPLVIACRNGHLEIVRYLVKKGADVELAGNVTFEGETIEKAPPLWCASAAGHLDIVKTLVSYGASVNNTTATLSTPLRAACFDGHLAIVQYLVDHGGDLEQANRHGHTCLMIACYRGHLSVVKFLLASSADVNRRSLKGNTALHDCAEAGRLEILKELLKHGAIMQRDSFGLTPILGAAAVGHACVVEYLSLESFQVCDLIDACSEEDQINALELLGATFVDKKRDIGKAIRFWNLALEIRGHFDHPKSDIVTHDLTESSEVCDPVLDSLSADESFKRCRLNAYEDVIEFMSLDDLNNMRSDPDQLRIQALLIRERILGYKHPDTAYFIRYRGAVFADFGRFDRCIALWMYALAIHQKMWEPLCAITQGNFISFAEVFAFMLNNESINAERHKRIQFDDVFRVLLRAVHELRRAFKLCDNDMKRSCSEASNTASVSPSTSTEQPINRGVACVPPCVHWNDQLNDLSANDFTDSDTSLSAQKRTENRCQRLHRMSMITLHLVCIVTKIDCSLLDADRERLCKLIYQLIQLAPKGERGASLLHMACSQETAAVSKHPVCRFPALDVIDLLLHCGIDSNQIDNDGNSALHVILGSRTPRPSICSRLLQYGAHVDRLNDRGKSPLNLLIAVNPSTWAGMRRPTSPGSGEPFEATKMARQLKLKVSLKCMAARSIKNHGISFKDIVPKSLVQFIDMH